MSSFPFTFECEHQEWSGSDIPFCECLLLRVPTENGYSIQKCDEENCPCIMKDTTKEVQK
jgi:hypothetical protein